MHLRCWVLTSQVKAPNSDNLLKLVTRRPCWSEKQKPQLSLTRFQLVLGARKLREDRLDLAVLRWAVTTQKVRRLEGLPLNQLEASQLSVKPAAGLIETC